MIEILKIPRKLKILVMKHITSQLGEHGKLRKKKLGAKWKIFKLDQLCNNGVN